MLKCRETRSSRLASIFILGAFGLGAGASAAGDLVPLATVPVPQPQGGDIIDSTAAASLGKVLFWDIQLGGDGRIACATCHFHAGVDNRKRNTLHPGNDGLFQSGGVTGPGQVFGGGDIANDDRVGSQGIVGRKFVAINPDPAIAADRCSPNHTAPFNTRRRVTGRQAPNIIGAVFNRDNFWDGRANHNFNGNDPFGATGNQQGAIGGLIRNASLASQAVGPPNNNVEVACDGRLFNGGGSLASKLLARPPLQLQKVRPTDSHLGALSAWPANGLTVSLSQMIAAAFSPPIAADAENRFSRIWGQAVQAYVSTLIPDQTPLDRFLAGNDSALTSRQERGLGIFTGKGQCIHCHVGPELTDASVGFAAKDGLINEDDGDQGFHNLGVRPTAEDLGRAGLGPNGVSFSVSGSTTDRGAFKTPGLRNLKLTAPYFHNGGKATLAAVVDFYNRGGDFANPEKAARIKPLSFDAADRAALVDFLTNGLTDPRVECAQAPFDHPSLTVPNGPTLVAVGAAGVCP